MSRPSTGKESTSVSFQIPVLARLDKYCFRTDLDRSYVVNRAVKKFLACELAEDPLFWEKLYDECDTESTT